MCCRIPSCRFGRTRAASRRSAQSAARQRQELGAPRSDRLEGMPATMIPQDPEEREVLAGEYVLGVLDPDQSREIEAALATDGALRDAVAFWEKKLHPLSLLAEPGNPPAALWSSIEARISPVAKPTPHRWSEAAPWRWSTGAFAAIAAWLLLYVAVVPK